MLEIPVGDCSCGDVLALDVFDSNKRRFLCANTVVNEYIRLRLKRSGTERVRIYDAITSGRVKKSERARCGRAQISAAKAFLCGFDADFFAVLSEIRRNGCK